MHTVTLIQSLVLTAVGMIVVFAFMGALIIIVHFYVALTTRFFPDRDEGDGDNNGDNGAKEAKQDSPEQVAAAIAAAIRRK